MADEGRLMRITLPRIFEANIRVTEVEFSPSLEVTNFNNISVSHNPLKSTKVLCKASESYLNTIFLSLQPSLAMSCSSTEYLAIKTSSASPLDADFQVSHSAHGGHHIAHNPRIVAAN